MESWEKSICLPVCLKILDSFARVNRRKYRRDLTEFLLESEMEDFQENVAGQVTISTIHKAKGKEFDHVSMLLNGMEPCSDEERRKIYVGITRARKSLDIHTTSSAFDAFRFPGLTLERDDRQYEEPETILLRLNHRDVILGFFRGKKKQMLQLCSGEKLYPSGDGLADETGTVLIRYSAACRERLSNQGKKGYMVQDASIRCIVAWKAEEDTEESAILLPDVYLKRRKPGAGDGRPE